MSDRFKFRYWDEAEKKMGSTKQYRNHSLSGFFCGFSGSGGILMQCTGLRDKNGTLIYEGDILKWKCSKSGSETEKMYIVTIDWREGGYHYSITIHDKGDKWATQKSYWNDLDREIIGNIYENPELLEKEE